MDKVEKVQRGDEMPPGVSAKMVKVLAVKQDAAGRQDGHVTATVVSSRIVAVEDMPCLEDVRMPTSYSIRLAYAMNVGQILET